MLLRESEKLLEKVSLVRASINTSCVKSRNKTSRIITGFKVVQQPNHYEIVRMVNEYSVSTPMMTVKKMLVTKFSE